MKPCDCVDQYSVDTYLNESGISFNGQSIEVKPLSVILRIDGCTLKIPQHLFERFANWYLEDQELKSGHKGYKGYKAWGGQD